MIHRLSSASASRAPWTTRSAASPACSSKRHVARIIAILDAWDGEPDKDGAEDDVLDGTLNGTGQWGDDGRSLGSEEDAEDGADSEPSLGWTLAGDWRSGTADDDCEHDTADSEPSEANDLSAGHLTIVSGGVPL